MVRIPWAVSAICRRPSNKLRGGLSGRNRSSGQAATADRYAKRAEGTGTPRQRRPRELNCAALEPEHSRWYLPAGGLRQIPGSARQGAGDGGKRSGEDVPHHARREQSCRQTGHPKHGILEHRAPMPAPLHRVDQAVLSRLPASFRARWLEWPFFRGAALAEQSRYVDLVLASQAERIAMLPDYPGDDHGRATAQFGILPDRRRRGGHGADAAARDVANAHVMPAIILAYAADQINRQPRFASLLHEFSPLAPEAFARSWNRGRPGAARSL